MNNKGFIENNSKNETVFVEDNFKKPFKSKDNQRKVDINILKARAQEIQNKENRKNISIFIFSLLVLVALAVYLSS